MYIHQQILFDLSQSLASVRGGKAKTGFRFNVQKWSVPDSCNTASAKKP